MKHMDDFFRDELGNYTETPPPAVWEALEKRLDKPKKKRRGIFYWFLIMLPLAGLLGVSILARNNIGNLFTGGKNVNTKKEINPTETNTKTAENNSSSEQNKSTPDNTIQNGMAENNFLSNKNTIAKNKEHGNNHTVAHSLKEKSNKTGNTSIVKNKEAVSKDDNNQPSPKLPDYTAGGQIDDDDIDEIMIASNEKNNNPVQYAGYHHLNNNQSSGNITEPDNNIASAVPMKKTKKHNILVVSPEAPVQSPQNNIVLVSSVANGDNKVAEKQITANENNDNNTKMVLPGSNNTIVASTIADRKRQTVQPVKKNTADRQMLPQTVKENKMAANARSIKKHPSKLQPVKKEQPQKATAYHKTHSKKPINNAVKQKPLDNLSSSIAAKKTKKHTSKSKDLTHKSNVKSSKNDSSVAYKKTTHKEKQSLNPAPPVKNALASTKMEASEQPAKKSSEKKTAKNKKTENKEQEPTNNVAGSSGIKQNNEPEPVVPAATQNVQKPVETANGSKKAEHVIAPKEQKNIAPATKDSVVTTSVTNNTATTNGGNDSTTKHKLKRLEAGMKGGYEGGFNNGAAHKGVVSPYIQCNLSPKFSIMSQPSIKASYVGNRNLSGNGTYYKADAGTSKFIDSGLTFVPDTSGTGSYYWRRNYEYTQTHDSISKTYALGGEYLEFELPILIKYAITAKLSVYGGVNIIYSKLVDVSENTYTSNSITETAAPFTLAPITSTAPPPPSMSSVFSYSGKPISSYTGPLYASTGDLLRLGYMLGFSYEYTKRWLLDVLVQQASVSAKIQGGYNTNSALSTPYFRLTIGYRIIK